MKNQLLSLTLFLAAGATLVAQQNRYVSSTGNDANPCSLTQPCRTFQGAINNTLAATVVALDGGDFGPVSISTPVIIDGGEHGAFISAHDFDAIHINMGPGYYHTPIIIRNVSIVMGAYNNSFYGVFANLQSGGLTLDHVSILSTTQDALATAPNGILVNAPPFAPIRLKDVMVSGVENGIYIGGSINAGFSTAATLENVSVDATLFCLAASDTSVTVRNSSFLSAARNSSGVILATLSSVPSSLIESTQIANHTTGLTIQGEPVRLSNSVVTGNVTGVNVLGGGSLVSFRNNTFAGNGTDGPISLSTSLK